MLVLRHLKPEGPVVNLKSIIILIACALCLFGTLPAFGQPCPEPVVITLGDISIDPCNPQRISIPVYMHNPCAIGGFSMKIYCTDPSWLHFTANDPFAADTFGSRISHWESFAANVYSTSTFRVNVSAIADMPGGDTGVVLLPGDGLLFTINLDYNDYTACDTSQLLNFGDVQVSSPDGYYLYERTLSANYVYVLPGNCSENPRADANCSGSVNGIDAVFLVNYLKGVGPSYCCLCSGDANNSDNVNGIDVTYLIGYFKGGPAPAPCD
jgi:hypothetical protein